MNRVIPNASLIFASFIMCGAAGAQVRGRVAAPPPPMARPVAVHVAPVTQPGPGLRTSILPPRVVHKAPAPPVTPNIRFVTNANRRQANGAFANASDAPGLGFDYSDFFALHPNNKDLDLDRGQNGGFQGFTFFSPLGMYGFPVYPTDTSAPDQSQAQTTSQEPQQQTQQQQQPQVIFVMPPGYQAVSGNAVATQANSQSNSQSTSAQASAADTVTASTEYVLVRRDGGVLFANAFSVQSGQMIYITPEGNRRKITLAELDVDATRKMNEERGTTISLPCDNSPH